MKLGLVVGLVLLGLGPAQAYTCEDVRWAVANLPAEQVRAIAATLTAEQRTQARACLKHALRRSR